MSKSIWRFKTPQRSLAMPPGRDPKGAVLAILAGALLLYAPAWGQSSEEQCAACHESEAKTIATSHSPHTAVGCLTCHAGHEVVPHPANLPKAGTADFRKNIPQVCGECHSQESADFNVSAHGMAAAQGIVAAPVCTDCHGEHAIVPPTVAASPVSRRNIRETCGSCHGDVRLARRFGLPADRLVSFDSSYHGLATKAGSETVANCASCHGVHKILSSSDPRSSINPKNLATTCGQCHPGAGRRFAISSVHLSDGTEPAPVRWVRRLYLWAIPIIVGLMFLHNAGDWAHKVYRLRLSRIPNGAPHGDAKPRFRMFALERAQHALLAISFIVLAWSGFALKYPGQWWARPVLLWEIVPVRSVIHRVAAVAFIAVAIMHVTSLILNARLRRHWQALVPNRRDFIEAAGGFRYNLGLRQEAPGGSEHSYVEKAEYWAVVWGGAVMVLTGVLLWATDFILAWLPKVILDVATTIHLYEAILAALAVLIWHFYSVIFDPDVYPLDAAVLSGFSTRPRRSGPKERETSEL